jgi:hypothetical protein
MRQNDHFEIQGERNLMNRCFDMMVIVTRSDNKQFIGKPLIMEELKMEGQRIEPTFSIPRDQATQLMDELWRLGVRPSSGEGNIGQIGAMNTHLQDMRTLAFNSLNLTPPKA